MYGMKATAQAPRNHWGGLAERVMHSPASFVGKQVDRHYWAIPEGYQLCAMTGKFHNEDDLLLTVRVREVFDKRFLLDNGIYIEEVDWLSEEGYEQIMAVLYHLGLYDFYREQAANLR